MSESRQTPGPWGVRETAEAIGDSPEALEAARADARLTAAAPGLKQALIGLLDGLDANGDPGRCGLSQQQWDGRVADARAALAAAAAARADARLIAAAPGLKEALEEISAGLQHWLENYGDLGGRLAALLGTARAALAKAEG